MGLNKKAIVGIQFQRLEQGLKIPTHFRCPISLDLMRDPVILCTGITYDRETIERWIDESHPATCPATQQELWDTGLVPNHTLRRLIQDWCVANRSKGVERIPTPRTPLDPQRAANLTASIAREEERPTALKEARAIAARGAGDRSRRVLIGSGAATTVGFALSDEWHGPRRMETLEDALATMVGLGDVVIVHGGEEAVAAVVTRGTDDGKVHAAAYVEALCGSGAAAAADLGHDVVAALVEMAGDRMYRRAARNGLAALHAASARSRRNAAHAVRSGAVPVLLDALMDGGRRRAEVALAALEALCRCKEGVAALAAHPLAVPLMVGNVLAGSERATEHAVGALWLLLAGAEVVLKSPKAQEDVIEEVIMANGFNQLLMLLQADVTHQTKHRTRDLLKWLKQAWAQHPCASLLTRTIM